ncbi:MFS general substrate transporter [Laetiporus sulphureus 93-53]|uniref:MFS general substrate transporter n=1 Tax=Laetiporus sulphureus 93-53 TaxID=1314785 RepID=A0A165C5V6_9APHY|nr:MFS general substrate transporter [Laetiporus sulphureus 93-53]KZT02257.1 MFS general substrate transporter [Laetiporus sulphureus 93-53]
MVADIKRAEPRGLKHLIWDTWEKPPEERRFLARLDACLLTYAALSYFSKYLDQQNITNAYVSGMKEELGLHGNELNYITTAWTCGYVIGQIPSNILITRIRPSIWIPVMEVIWSVLTMTLASAKNFTHLVVIRFFVGLAESTFYPSMQYVVGSWYKPDELGKRACIFHTASAIGPMISGFLQTGAYDGLNGRFGLAGWKWLFIIDGIITIPIALFGFIVMPDLPSNTSPSFIYSKEQIELAQRRMEEVGRRPPARFTKRKVLGFFKTWHLYLLTLLYILFNNGGNPSSSMIFWLKSFNTSERTVYTIAQINTYPLPIYGVQVVTTLAWAWWSDAVRARWPPMVVAGLWNMVVCIVLAASPVYQHITRRWVFYYMTLVTGGLSGLILSWANELTGHDSEKRAFVVACCNTFAYVVQTWFPTVLFPQVEQPRVLKGNIATACVNFAMVCTALLVLFLSRRDAKRAAAREIQSETDDGKEDDENVKIDKVDDPGVEVEELESGAVARNL